MLDSMNLISESYTTKLGYGTNFIDHAEQYFKSIKPNVKITITQFPVVGQTDGHTCGAWMLCYLEQLSKQNWSLNNLSVTMQDVDSLRSRMKEWTINLIQPLPEDIYHDESNKTPVSITYIFLIFKSKNNLKRLQEL